jgi:hypothetical protein
MIGSLLSKMATAGKLSIPQLQKSIQDGTIPSYIGIPMLDEMVNQQKQAQAFAGAQQQGQPPIAEQVMQAANQVTQQPAPQMPMQEQAPQGITSAQSNLPTEYAGGGIVAFGKENSKEQLVEDEGFFGMLRRKSDEYNKRMQPIREKQIQKDQAAKGTPAPPTPPTPFMQDIAGIGTGLKENVLNPAISGISELSRRAKGYFIDPALNPRDVEAQEGYNTKPSTTTPAPVTPAPVTPNMVVNRDKGGPKRSPNGPEEMPMYEGIFADKTAPAVAPTVAPTKEGIAQLTAADERSKQLTGDLADLKGLISGSYNDPEKALTQKALLAMLKGGLRAAAGTSMNPITNIAQGAEEGVSELGKGIDQIDADKRAKASQLIALGLKGTELRQELAKLGITENWYAAHYPGLAAQAALHTAQAKAVPGKMQSEADLTNAQIDEIRQGKIPYYRGRASRPSSTGGPKGIGNETVRKVEDQFAGYVTDPKTALSSPLGQFIPPKTDPKNGWIRQGLEAKPGTESYNNAMNAVSDIANQRKNILYKQMYLLGGRNTAPSIYGQEPD